MIFRTCAEVDKRLDKADTIKGATCLRIYMEYLLKQGDKLKSDFKILDDF